MGYAIVMGFCGACKAPLSFNPRKVPSIRINGLREPLCLGCVERWCVLHPDAKRPDLNGAYDEVAEDEL